MFTKLQYLTPRHLLSRLAGIIANCKLTWVRDRTIGYFLKRHHPNMAETKRQEIAEYTCFNDFFTRTLLPEARPIDPDARSIVSPVDGYIGQIGSINNYKIIQAKKHDYSLQALLANRNNIVEPFINGKFTTIYLAPHNYHRIHCPIDATLEQMTYVPGKLFSVNTKAVANIPGLFARNERVIIIFNTKFGKMAVVLVGATFVGSIATPWAGTITPNQYHSPHTWHYAQLAQNPNMQFKKGAEIGKFLFGSTVIVLFEKNALEWNAAWHSEASVEFGQMLGAGLSP